MEVEEAEKFLKENLKTDEQKISFCVGFLGIAAHFVKYIDDHLNDEKPPEVISYCSAIVAANMLAILGVKVPVEVFDMSKLDLPQRDKLLMVVKHLYEVYKDEINAQKEQPCTKS